MSEAVWFRAATIAVPICGGFILVLLILLALRVLKKDSKRVRELAEIQQQQRQVLLEPPRVQPPPQTHQAKPLHKVYKNLHFIVFKNNHKDVLHKKQPVKNNVLCHNTRWVKKPLPTQV